MTDRQESDPGTAPEQAPASVEYLRVLTGQLRDWAQLPGTTAAKTNPKHWVASLVRRLNPMARWNEAQHRRLAELVEVQTRLMQSFQEQAIEARESVAHCTAEAHRTVRELEERLEKMRTEQAGDNSRLNDVTAVHENRLEWTLNELQQMAVSVVDHEKRLEWTLDELKKMAVAQAEQSTRLDEVLPRHTERLEWTLDELKKLAVTQAEHAGSLEWMTADLRQFAANEVQQTQDLEELRARVKASETKAQSVAAALRDLPAALDTRLALAEKMSLGQEADVESVRLHVEALGRRLDDLADKKFEAHVGRVPFAVTAAAGVPQGIPAGEFNFLEWEAFTRGTEARIADQQKVYAKWFAGAPGPVLDAGCGRGEFLEVLRGDGVEAYGIDTDTYMVEYCRSKGLRVDAGDLFEHINALPDGSLGGLFLGHVVEHLPLDVLLAFFPLAHRKLAAGAALIMETPNPMCLTTFSGAFYADPTHIKPIHPKAMEFLCAANGFTDMTVIPSAPVPPEEALRVLSEKEPVAPAVKDLVLQMNANIAHLNQVLFSYGNYAMAARKSGTEKSCASHE